MDAIRFIHALGYHLEGLVAVARDTDNDGFVARYSSLLDKFFCYRYLGPACGFGKDPFGASQKFDAVNDLFVGNALPPSSRFTHCLEHVEAVSRIADGNRARDGIWFYRADEICPLLKGLDYGGTAGRLRRIDLALSVLNQPDLLEFLECLGEFGKDGPPCGGNHDMAREFPSQLFRNLEAVRFGPFGVVGSEIHVDEGPTVLIGNLAAQPVDVVIISFNRNGARAVDGGADDFPLFQPVGNKDVAV